MRKLSEVDTNLLVVFDLLYQHRNTQVVAEQLGQTQPAVSHALKRLRKMLGDELFERTSQGLMPTPYATHIHEPISKALSSLQETLNLSHGFDPATSQRRFQITMSDIGEIYFLPRLMSRLAEVAPHVSLRTTRSDLYDIKHDMEEGHIDLAVGLIPQLGAGFYQQRLFVQNYVCLMRENHHLARGTFSQEDFAKAQHIVVEAQGTGHGRIEELLARSGINPPIRLRLPHFVAVPYIINDTDLVVTVTDKLAEATASRFGLCAIPHPLALPEVPINLFWHRRFHQDAGNQWLRRLIHEMFAET
ncbi:MULTISPECIES: LysR family transcriptional regulator [Chromohalobacter]|uniref:LysR family transcriptional regulator n=1 Tax=Chromohalobacter canadensis TaxID=141389 RepID=A0ABZ0YE09_9GAMM|nr:MULTISPECIES: LysR family transcriptional regulator [Chromohalobacter]MCK0769550.1 LysR family transcriptional regulator [Chromohalobacter canadensis]WQH10332.1 LysR family transcriptional regulator [Chromohalobacter canadensis]